MIAGIVDKATALGASLAGIVKLDETVRARIALPDEVDPTHPFTGLLVLALAHGEDQPELDWWGGPGGTEGNRRLQEISDELRRALAEEHGIRSRVLPYHPWKGGILLKNAAALAGLGAIGANNLLITPQYGPRVRLRAMLLGSGGTETGFLPKNPVSSPCEGCPRPCWRACPQEAFASGAYDRARCAVQMELDETRTFTVDGGRGMEAGAVYVDYCRACELACPVGT
jgi:epoxyqueuosine reductase